MRDCGTILIVDSDEASRLTAVQAAVRLGYDARPTPTADELRSARDRAPTSRSSRSSFRGRERLRGHAPAPRRVRGRPSVILVSAVRSTPSTGGRAHARRRRLSPEPTRRRRAPRSYPALAAAGELVNCNGNGNGTDRNDYGAQPARAADPGAPRGRPDPGPDRRRLVISSKTVATHIQHVLSKLGFSRERRPSRWRSREGWSSRRFGRTRWR